MATISSQVSKIIEDEIEMLVKKISVDYKLDLEELKKKYELMFINYPEVVAETPKKQRGRKKKVKDEYISTNEYLYNGVTYLVDQKNNVYTYNVESPTQIGEKLVDGTIKFVKGYVSREAPTHSD